MLGVGVERAMDEFVTRSLKLFISSMMIVIMMTIIIKDNFNLFCNWHFVVVCIQQKATIILCFRNYLTLNNEPRPTRGF